ncbi:hypothetical protein LINGRAPRIM_LOCUS2127 [Linum grandiflorum]
MTVRERERERERALYISNLPSSADEAYLRHCFSDRYGDQLVSVIIDGPSEGYLTFGSHQVAKRILDEYNERPVLCWAPTVREGYPPVTTPLVSVIIDGLRERERELYISNLPSSADEAYLRHCFFDRYGDQLVSVIMDGPRDTERALYISSLPPSADEAYLRHCLSDRYGDQLVSVIIDGPSEGSLTFGSHQVAERILDEYNEKLVLCWAPTVLEVDPPVTTPLVSMIIDGPSEGSLTFRSHQVAERILDEYNERPLLCWAPTVREVDPLVTTPLVSVIIDGPRERESSLYLKFTIIGRRRLP